MGEGLRNERNLRPTHAHRPSLPPPGTAHLMNARELVELASLAAAYGRILMRGDQPLPDENVQRYWVDSKVRFDRWTSQLRRFAEEPRYIGVDAVTDSDRANWATARVLIEEIFLSEVLTRVWTAVGIGVDRAQGGFEVEPIVRSVMTGHTDACNRAMRILLDLPRKHSADAAALDNVRVVAGRWTDVLIGVVSIDEDLTSLASDPTIARDMADELRSRASRGQSGVDHAALIGPLLATTRALTTEPTLNEDLNARIAASVVACFRPALFDGAGVLRFEWLYRLHQVTLDSQLMIGEWLDDDLKAKGDSSGGGNAKGKGRRGLLKPSLLSTRWPFRFGVGDDS